VETKELERISQVLTRVKRLAKTDMKAKVVTKNNFPKATGIASSASGLSAVTVATCTALGLKLSQKELSKLARLASGTAARSIPDGFVEWEKGSNEANSYAKQIFPADYWKIRDVVAIVSHKMKKVKSTQGHALADTSPFQRVRLKGMPARIRAIKQAIKQRDFNRFGQILEAECLSMHAVCLTSQPPILYWEATTMEIMRQVQAWRDQGLESYFTIDAGPTVHVICKQRDTRRLLSRLRKISGIERLSINAPGQGARVVQEPLF